MLIKSTYSFDFFTSPELFLYRLLWIFGYCYCVSKPLTIIKMGAQKTYGLPWDEWAIKYEAFKEKVCLKPDVPSPLGGVGKTPLAPWIKS